jgi:hypothetical protein
MRYAVILLIAVASLISAENLLGQSRQIAEAELTKLIAEAAQKRKGIPQRQMTSTTGYDAGDSSEILYEFGPDDTSHYVSIRRAKGIETRTEGIRIRDVRYTRQKDGSWMKEPPREKTGGSGSGFGSGSGSSSSSPSPPEKTTEYLYIGKEKTDGKKTEHYRKTSIVKFTLRSQVVTRRNVYDYWFNADGLMVKESHEDAFENSNRRYTTVTKYEYDKDIKITAPIPN